MSLRIASGLRELGHTEFAVLGERIVGIENPPPMDEILAAADVREARIAAESEVEEARAKAVAALQEQLLEREGQRADAPQAIKDYLARRPT